MRGTRIGKELGHVDALTRWRERLEARDALSDERRGTVEVAVAPVVETDADLQDAVIEVAHRRARGAP